MQLAELAAERLVLIEAELLVAEEDHLMRHQRIVNFLEHLIAERLRQVDPRDLRPDNRADRLHFNALVRHGVLPFGVGIPSS